MRGHEFLQAGTGQKWHQANIHMCILLLPSGNRKEAVCFSFQTGKVNLGGRLKCHNNLLVNESRTWSLASLSPFLVLFAVHRIHPNLPVLLSICLSLSNRRGRRVLMPEEAQLSKSYLNVHFQSSQELLSMCLPGCAPMYTPPCKMLFSFHCDLSDCWSTCYLLKLLPEFILGKLLFMQFIYIPVFLHSSTLFFHILCHFEGGL